MKATIIGSVAALLLVATPLTIRIAGAQSVGSKAKVPPCVPNIPSKGDVLVTGGENRGPGGDQSETGQTEFFHVATGQWMTGCPTKVAHDEAQLLPYKTGLLEIGGESSKLDRKDDHILNSTTEFYDPATGKFKLGPALRINLEDFAAVALNDGSLMVIGGITNSDKELPVKTAEILKKGTWKTLKHKMSIPRAAPCAAVMTAGPKAEQVLIAGGTDTSEFAPQLASAELYNPATGTFTLTSNQMNQGRSYAVCTALNDGTVLITGGIDNNGNAYDTAEIYNPATDRFTFTNNNMSDPRVDHSATLLNDGTVLVAGGETTYSGAFNPLDTADLYDPATGKFTALPTMNDIRDDSTATLIKGSGTALDGQVLIAGGFTFSSSENTAELYDPAHQTFTPTSDMNFVHGAANAAVIP